MSLVKLQHIEGSINTGDKTKFQLLKEEFNGVISGIGDQDRVICHSVTSFFGLEWKVETNH